MVDLCNVNAWLLWRRNKEEQYMLLYDFKLAISEHFDLSKKVITREHGHPAPFLRTPTSSCCGDRPISLPASPESHEKARKTPARHQDFSLNSVRRDEVDHFQNSKFNDK
ncbi:hypothetical protein HHI36_001520, partial [Cryptolaemus montrouzieri]